MKEVRNGPDEIEESFEICLLFLPRLEILPIPRNELKKKTSISPLTAG